jgi:hypothetical protein
MDRAMKSQPLATWLLRLRLACFALGPLACGAALLCVLSAGALLWLLPQRAMLAQRQALALSLAAVPAGAPKAAPVTADRNLALFYDTLGEKRYAEQQVKTLFGLAAKTGLTLSHGEYKGAYDRNGRLYTYQVTLPVKGSYRAIWQFGLLALRAIPFASLDEISFKRETIGDANVEARLRLTLYLADQGAQP